ncbi:MAG TPA: malate synthase A [Gammaproteobacteria bacterium]|jgi:malate synthase|nr:malate synthase A [Chromatiales bacterium]MCP4925736.1 malate synthase A [Gammaproteobacteria bacterium]MDP7660071.1 malate synthase A [Gammaproteobacteria bacterium]HJP37818.1 malate synthase A [Gammaproteobacteria bacterium]
MQRKIRLAEQQPCIEFGCEIPPPADEILNPDALALVVELHQRFNPRRLELLAARSTRQLELDKGVRPAFLPATALVRSGDWRIAAIPHDLVDRRVEITGPVERKMVINALNSPAKAFMADFEDSCSPTWANIVLGQVNLRDAVNRSISFENPENGKVYRLNDETATLMVRPRGWHLDEKHCLIDGERVSASLFDFALYLANNHEQLRASGSGPYFYLPKLESHLEARLWNDVFIAAQEALGIPVGTIKATVLIETILAAFEMDEILYELRQHSAGLNCGRWDYIFSFIKKFRQCPDFVLPDRSSVTMDRHFLKSYVQLLIKTCHRRGAHAMGGMAAQIPIKNDDRANAIAMSKVREDKEREANAGHDGTWIAHPGLASIAITAFDSEMAGPNQLDISRDDVEVTAEDLLQVPGGAITEAGLRENIRVGVQYVEAWMRGQGCVPLYNLMEDAATAEICRSQIWQWIQHNAQTIEGLDVAAHFDRLLDEELKNIEGQLGSERFDAQSFHNAAKLFGGMIKKHEFDEFLTLPAYEALA